jgi:hypothetical protein
MEAGRISAAAAKPALAEQATIRHGASRNPQSAVTNPQSNRQSAIRNQNPQWTSRNRQSAVGNLQC